MLLSLAVCCKTDFHPPKLLLWVFFFFFDNVVGVSYSDVSVGPSLATFSQDKISSLLF